VPLHFDFKKFFQILTFVYAVHSVCVSARGHVFAKVLHISLHINVREGFLRVRCIVSLRIAHDILCKSNAVAFNFLVSKSTQQLGFQVGIEDNQMCSFFWHHCCWVVLMCMARACVARCLNMGG
jgi:hypothetical protein